MSADDVLKDILSCLSFNELSAARVRAGDQDFFSKYWSLARVLALRRTK
jgi:hypothetical protein